jgi:hypothetical protein
LREDCQLPNAPAALRLLVHPGAKEDWLLHLDALLGIAIAVHQLFDAQLPRDFFRIGSAICYRALFLNDSETRFFGCGKIQRYRLANFCARSSGVAAVMALYSTPG